MARALAIFSYPGSKYCFSSLSMLLAGDTAKKVSIHGVAKVSLKFFIVHVCTKIASSIVKYCIISFNLRDVSSFILFVPCAT